MEHISYWRRQNARKTRNTCILAFDIDKSHVLVIISLGREVENMAKSSRIQEIVLNNLADKQKHSVREMKEYLSKSDIGDYSEGQFAGSLNTLLRNGSIEKVDRGVYMIKKGSESMKKCFVVSPIGEVGSETRNSADKLYKHVIKPVCEICGFEAIRVDQLNDANSITQTIIEYLETADLVIADVSDRNPNVFYEIGFRTRTNKPIIHLKGKNEKLPFDINTIRTFEYDLTDLDSVEEIKGRLEQTINAFSFMDIEEETEGDDGDKGSSTVLPILYQILDSIADLKEEVRGISSGTIETVIKSMQNTQPTVSSEDAMQTQLIGSLLQNPDSFLKLMELSERFPKSKK